MGKPAFFRVGFAAGTGELYIAYDLGLAPEKPSAEFAFSTFPFDNAWGFRGAVARLYEVYPEYFRCRTPQQGIWMPFHAISEVEGWQDFGFKFKEGNDETAWDDAHDIITFRYSGSIGSPPRDARSRAETTADAASAATIASECAYD